MKKSKILLYIFLVLAAAFLARTGYFVYCNATYKPQEGDVIFHVSESGQSTAIKVGTLSRYSHCGIIIINKPWLESCVVSHFFRCGGTSAIQTSILHQLGDFL